MAKRTDFDRVFPTLKQTIEEAAPSAVKFGGVIKDIVKQLERMVQVTADGVKLNNGGTLAELNALAKAYTEQENAIDALGKAKLLQLKIEQEELKIKTALTKEAERQARNAEKAATAVKKEVGAYAMMSKQLTELRNKWKDLAAQNQHNTKEGRELLKSVTDLDKELKKIDATVGQHQRNVGNYRDALANLPGAFGGAVRGAQALQTSLLALLKNPIVLVIAALVAYLTLLFKAFTKSDEGGAKFARIMEQVGSIINVLIARVGKVAEAMLLLFQGKWSEAADKFKESVEGVQDQLKEAAEAAGKYADELERIEDAEISYISQAAKNANLIARLEFDAANRNLSNKARRDSLAEAQRIGEEETAKMKGFLQDRYEAKLEFVAKERKVDKELLRSFIEANDENAEFIKSQNADLARARNEMGDAAHKELEEMHAAVINEDTKFFEQQKGNMKKMSGLDKELKAEQKARDDKALDDKKKFYEKELKMLKDHNDEKQRLLDEDDEETKTDAENKAKAAAAELDLMRASEDLMEKVGLKRVKSDEEIAADRLKIQQDLAGELLKLEEQLADELENRSKKKIDAIDKEIDARQKQADFYRALAASGNKDASQSIAIEEKRIADLEAKREKAAQKARNQELYIAAIQGYTAKVQSGDKNAVFSELADLAKLMAGIALLPKFFEGTEDTGTVANPFDANGGRPAMIHDNERIVPKHLNKKFHGLPNEAAADIVDMAMRGAFDMPLPSGAAIAIGGSGLNELKDELKVIAENTSKWKQETVQYDKITGYLTQEIRENGKTTRNNYRRQVI